MHIKYILIFSFLITISSCATRGVPLSEQTPTFSEKEYTKLGSKDGRDVYVAKSISDITSAEVSRVLAGSSQKYSLEEKDQNSYLLKEKNPVIDSRAIVVIGNNNSPTLVDSSTSQKRNSVLIQSGREFYSNKVNENTKNTQYAH